MRQGSITTPMLIVVASFIVAIYALLLVLSLQLDFSHRQTASEEALGIAEAGINYYKWRLAHAPEDFGGSGEYEYFDPQGASVGKYKLEITPPQNGSSIVTIRSTGWTNQFPNIKRSITAQYGIPSFARYSFLQHSSSWYGTGITVNGRVHSNNGIRMDGTNTSIVSSAKETYTCGSETGCNPPQTRPGVWGSGGDKALWQFPVPQIDFASVSFDFSKMRTSAQNNGVYLGPSGRSGYHLTFLSDGTVRVDRVDSVGYYYGVAAEDGCQRRYQRILTQSYIGTYNLSDTPIIFAEDHLWVEGVVKGRTSVVAARFPVESNFMNIWIRGNITYAAYDHTNSLGLIAQNDIYFVRDIPNYFQIDAALMAQGGKIIRHGYYNYGSCSSSSYSVRERLTINGALISYNKSYWNFGSPPVSGFRERVITYDGDLLYAPPPYFPTTGEYEFISWSEE